ncbi:capsule biosynthesis protein [Sulfurimonas sediminis]|uniref:Capsule biosynthesis protein n=1 Tax=Sulfurimonas sediminis TaxID=2590020 RepID=A0A7M1AZ10_9BACT|nr:capsule biosynthesis protein [Sulfurimonas sediminis]QOP42683.1 capsule biosynthesis protein [Sulfurimonas sediminis]
MHYFFGFSYWKHQFTEPFFPELNKKEICFINPFLKKNYFKLAMKKGLNEKATVYIWGKKSFPLVEEYAKEHKLKLYRVEDGFIRSVGLGSDLTQPYSLVVDSKGIYFDPTNRSDLEHILQTYTFDTALLQRAKNVQNFLLQEKLSKYNLYENIKLNVPKDQKIVLVPGQVEDDASIRYGANGMTNLMLLRLARQNAKDAYIIYKPHPDVLVGNRVGHIEEKTALEFADEVVTEVGLESVLEVADEIHTMTSLVGFEALMRGKKVFTYGMPFYAGWGLTKDTAKIKYRNRKLSVLELIAATLIIYPRYLDPNKKELCQIENVLYLLKNEKELYQNAPCKKLQNKIRNYISRKLQLILRIIAMKG